ncbi:uncharacterized protein BO80DRAFT_427911 [Aspergillus ibericus CBS 121593]|uniref:Mucin-7 n=1 Tax=Aspergillus ibericus CBS 121593 TaxID=1448316 RepID=A0A395GT31_9EURO|nr:hypothetical protein BO80DRAFT_427911 [Aspergillus ibericus CBS 121593]RAK97847.1 hypothetical protein BO80DRAFT_427911 [Aspergillus ibericus CBS 121593]
MPSDSFSASVRSAESPLRLSTSVSSTTSTSDSPLPSPSRQDQYPLLTSRYRHLSPKRAAIMNEAGGHPGVRNLLARFENNQSNTTSPPSRGRSPVGSEHSGSGRPLSKVRASFVAVDGATQPNPLAGLRSVSGRSDSPAAPSRVRSFNSEDFEGGLKSPLSVSPTRNSFPFKITEPPAATLETKQEELPEKNDPAPVEPEKPVEVVESPPAPEPTLKVPEVSSPKPTKTVTKRPSTIQVNKPAPKPAAKSPAQPRTPTSPAKPEDKATRTTRTARPATTRATATEAPKVATHKLSRTSLNPATKPATRPARSSMPARDLTKPTTSAASRTTKVTPANTTRPSASATTSTASSTVRKGATTTSTLSRKPSTIKSSTTATQQRAITPTASTTRKPSSRPSPPTHSGSERPHSRVSNTSSRPLDEGFLARMMRPTASSASKTHDKVEVKSPPRPAKPARAPRRVPSKLDTRTSRATKLEPGKPLEKRATPEPVKSEPPQAKAVEEAAKESVAETAVVPEKPVEVAEEVPAEEPVQASAEAVAEEVAVPATEAVPEANGVTEDSAEAAVEQATDLPPVPETEPVAETTVPVEEATKESTEPKASIEASTEAPAEVAAEAQSSEVDIDMGVLTLN